MGISDFISMYQKYGLKGGIGVFFIALVYISHKTGLFTKLFTYASEKFIENFIKKKGKVIVSDVTTSDITNHDIFNYIDFWIHSRIPIFQFSTEYRTAVFRKYLVIYLKKYKENLLEFVNAKSYLTMDEAELWKGLLSLINNTIHDYEREMALSGIPSIIISKMKTKNSDTISLTIDLIEGICNSQFYKSDNLLKIYSILNIILSILENTIQNSEHVCNSINGSLAGMKFEDNGKTYIEPGSKS
jgi:hypothetical protein